MVKILAMKKKYHINVVKGLKKSIKENNQLKLTPLQNVTKIKSATNKDLLRLTDILSI